jgi:sigma-54 specific flagellar transcriptional regulator A
MSQTPQEPFTSSTSEESLWVLVIDDDRLSSHSLSILLRFVGETPVLATSDSWAESLRMLSGSGAQSQILAAAFGQVRKGSLAEALAQVHAAAPMLPLLLLGGSDSELSEVLPQAELATLPESLRKQLLTPGDGALNNQRLLGALNQARRLTGRAENLQQSVLLSPTGSVLFRSLSGQSAPITKVKNLLHQVAKRPTSVLVRGESGTGKEIVARNLHYHSGRSTKPFIAVNCATIASDQQGVELFGQARGEPRPGLIERADGGTLFLDEIAELPLNIQATLLRFLEDKQFQRLGGNDVLTADVRIVAGTRQNLEAKMREGKFREDLFYRLSIVPIELPPLRQRLEDIPELVKELISSLENRDQTSVRFNSQALQSLQKHNWPGNVRELANLVERLGIMHPNAVLGVSDLPPEYQYAITEDVPEPDDVEEAKADTKGLTLVQTKPVASAPAVDDGAMLPLNETRLQQYLDAFEKQLLEVALEDSAGMIDFAAERLQVDPASLRAMMQAHGIRERAPR